MSSVHRAGLLTAGLVTGVAVAAVFTVQGYMTARQAQAQAVVPVATDAANTTAPDPTTLSAADTLPPQVIYIAPQPTPAPATPAPAVPNPPQQPATQPGPQPTPPIIHVIVPSPTGEQEGPGGDD